MSTSPIDLEIVDMVSGGWSVSGEIPRGTYTFNLHRLPILDRSGKGHIWMPPIVQLFLFLGRNIKRYWTYVADFRETHVGGAVGWLQDSGAVAFGYVDRYPRYEYLVELEKR